MLRGRSQNRESRKDSGAAVGYIKYQREWLNRSSSPLYREQRKVLLRFARDREFHLIRVFCDEHPGTLHLLGCRELVRLFVHIEDFKYRTVLVDKASRLHDDPVVVGLMLRYCVTRGLEVFEASTHRRLTSPQVVDDFLRGHAEVDLLQGRKLMDRFARLVKSGGQLRPRGRTPFGTTVEEDKILKRIRELSRVQPKDRWRKRGRKVLVRRSFQEIADVLNQEGKKTREGSPWAAGTVRGIVERRWPDLSRCWCRDLN